MSDKFVMMIRHGDKSASVDFVKGLDHVEKAMRSIGFPYPYLTQCKELEYKITAAESEIECYLSQIIQKEDYFMDIYRAYYYVTEEIGFDDYILPKLKNHEVNSLISIIVEGDMYRYRRIIGEINIQPHSKTFKHDLKFQEIKIFGRPALYTEKRISQNELPDNIYRYECQHDDDQLGIITMIGEKIMLNFWGTILINGKIELDDGYRMIDEDRDIEFLNKPMISISDYLDKYPSAKKGLER